LIYNSDYGRLGVHAAVQAEVARATSAAVLPFRYEWAQTLWAAIIRRYPDYTAFSCI